MQASESTELVSERSKVEIDKSWKTHETSDSAPIHQGGLHLTYYNSTLGDVRDINDNT